MKLNQLIDLLHTQYTENNNLYLKTKLIKISSPNFKTNHDRNIFQK